MKLLNYIKGRFEEPKSAEWIDNLSPSTGEVIGSVPLSGDSDVKLAVGAAREALPEWSGMNPSDRAEWLDRIADCLEEKFEQAPNLLLIKWSLFWVWHRIHWSKLKHLAGIGLD